MSDPEDQHEMNSGGRIVGETGEVLQVDGDWHIEDHDNDDGPVIRHVPCNVYICDLNRKYPLCRGCGEAIPPSMISGFTMLNWNKADDSEYFVPMYSEVMDFVYNGHLQQELRQLSHHPAITEEDIAKVMEGLTGETT
jgi:hypothetical protein